MFTDAITAQKSGNKDALLSWPTIEVGGSLVAQTMLGASLDKIYRGEFELNRKVKTSAENRFWPKQRIAFWAVPLSVPNTHVVPD